MADFEAQMAASWVKIEPLDGPIDSNQSNREKVGEIYRLAPDHLCFVCAQCGLEFSLLIQFTAHVQSHLIQIHSDYIEPKASPFDECDGIFYEAGAHVHHQLDDNDVQSGITQPMESITVDTADVEIVCSDADRENSESTRNNDQHGRPMRQCATCRKYFKSIMLHQRWSKQCNPAARTYECYLCRVAFRSKMKCKQHVREAHMRASCQCQYCDEKFIGNLSHHNEVCGASNAFRCEHCPCSFRTEVLLNVHGRKVHGIKPKKRFRCKICVAEVFDERVNWALHMKECHSIDRVLKCDRCNSVFTMRTDLIKHAVACAGTNRVCRICAQTFDDQAAKDAHMLSHEKKYQCDECGRQFLTQQHLRNHMNSHSDVRKYKCNECAKTYKHAADLSSHKRTHRGVRAHKCDLCAGSYFFKSTLQKHQWRVHRVASNEKMLSEHFLCTVCNKVYSTAYILSVHMRRHTGENLLQCPQCESRCTNQNELDKHIQSHSDRRDFQCELCPKAFKRKDALVAHTRIHLGDFKFACKWCDSKFHDNRIYKRHTLSAHGRQWNDVDDGEGETV